MSQLDPDGALDAAPLSAIPPATRMAVAEGGDRGPRPATSLIDIKQQSDRVRVAQRGVDDQTNDSDDADEPSSRPKRNNATFQNINSANHPQDTSPNMSSPSSFAALPQGSSTSTPTPTPTATPTPVHPNVRRTMREGGSSRTSSSRRPKEPGSATTGVLSTTPSDLPRERRPKIRTVPHLPHGPADPAPPTLMYWSRAPVYGQLPSRSMRAHTVTLVENTAWLFGGCDDKGCAKDLWTFDVGASVSFVPCNPLLTNYFAETFQWSHPEMTGDLPPPCRAHTATLVDRRIFIFGGGEGPSYYNSLYILDTVSRKWTHTNPPEPLPLPRRAHTTVLYRNKLYIFGGGNGVKALNDVWSLDTSVPVERMRWELLKTHGEKPGPRGYHTANLVGNIMIVIGGSDGRDCFSDIWVLNLGTTTPLLPFIFGTRTDVSIRKQTPLPGRWSRRKGSTSGSRIPRRKSGVSCSSWEDTMASNTLKSCSSSTLVRPSLSPLLFLPVHCSHPTYHNPTHIVTLQFEPKPTAGRPPAARGYHVSLLADGRLFVFGGFDGHSVYDDVWILDLAGAAYLPQVTSFQLLIE